MGATIRHAGVVAFRSRTAAAPTDEPPLGPPPVTSILPGLNITEDPFCNGAVGNAVHVLAVTSRIRVTPVEAANTRTFPFGSRYVFGYRSSWTSDVLTPVSSVQVLLTGS